MYLFWSKNAIFSSLGLIKRRPSYRRSLLPSIENSQRLKNEIYWLFSLFVGRFCSPGSVYNLDMDPDPTPDLQHCCYYGQNFLDKMTKQSDKYIATFYFFPIIHDPTEISEYPSHHYNFTLWKYRDFGVYSMNTRWHHRQQFPLTSILPITLIPFMIPEIILKQLREMTTTPSIVNLPG